MYIRDDVDNGEEESYYYLYDGQGNVVEVANKVGDLPWYLYTYTTYGNTSSYQFDKISAPKSMDSGNDGIASHTLAMTSRYFYFGKMASVESNEGEDDLLGLYKSYDEGPFGYKTGVRHYDPETGVFISPDPFKGYMGDPPSQHPYMYCHGNPVKYADPSGYAIINVLYGKNRPRYTKAELDILRDNGNNTVYEFEFDKYNFIYSLANADYTIIKAHGNGQGPKGELQSAIKADGSEYWSNDFADHIVNSSSRKCKAIFADFCFSGNFTSYGSNQMSQLKSRKYVGYTWSAGASASILYVVRDIANGAPVSKPILNRYPPKIGPDGVQADYKIYPWR
jgi:RHS repeat-associated protein